MRLTDKRIEEILVKILGEEGIPLIHKLIGKENVSEFDLATRTKLDIKVVRRLLYNLYNHNVVGFNRKKDKIKGWYIYYWTLLPESIRFSYFKMKRDMLEKLKEQMSQENSELFFVCPNNCVRLNFDQGMDFEFHCPECGELIHQDIEKNRIEKLQKKIDKMEKEVEDLIKQRIIKPKKSKEVIKEVKKKVTTKKTVKKSVKKESKNVKKKVTKKTVATKKKSKKVTNKKILKKEPKKKTATKNKKK
jgi:transcription initiation factor TFIIE subunit alpha